MSTATIHTSLGAIELELFAEDALARATEGFARLGCEFEHARCLEIAGDGAAAREVYARMGAAPAMERAAR